MKQKRYYIDTRGNDDDAYREAIQFACQLAEDDTDIKRVVLLTLSESNPGWLDRIYGSETVKNLFNGVKFNDCAPTFIIKTLNTYSGSHPPQDVVITMGMDTENVMEVDDLDGVRVVIAIPWRPELLNHWVRTYGPVDIRSNVQSNVYPLPTPVVQEAMKDLTSLFNASTGIRHTMDGQRAKIYVQALYGYDDTLNGDEVVAYLTRELSWKCKDAKAVKHLIDTVNRYRNLEESEQEELDSYLRLWKKSIKSG